MVKKINKGRDNVKVVPELGANSKGEQQGGIPVEMTEEFMKEENKITSQMDSDPLLKLKSREVDLRAMENDRKANESREKMDLDKMKTMMNQQNQDEKLQQNEELANLRADTSIEKTILSKTIPSADSVMKNTSNMVPNVEIMRKG